MHETISKEFKEFVGEINVVTSGLDNCTYQGDLAQVTASFSNQDFEENTENQVLQDDEPFEPIPVDENFPGREIYRELTKDGSNFD